MKIWKSFSGEHSAKLKIIGKFKSSKDAEDAATLFNGLLEIDDRFSSDPNKSYSQGMLNYFMDNNFTIEKNDIENLDLFYPIEAEGDIIEVKTDDWGIQPLLQAMIHFGAKIEIYSQHDHSI